jgi:hypothetical protein
MVCLAGLEENPLRAVMTETPIDLMQRALAAGAAMANGDEEGVVFLVNQFKDEKETIFALLWALDHVIHRVAAESSAAPPAVAGQLLAELALNEPAAGC